MRLCYINFKQEPNCIVRVDIARELIVVVNSIAGMLTRWIDSLATDC